MKLRTRPRSSWSICGSVVEHWSSEIRRSEVQFQFNSSWDSEFFLCATLVTRRKNVSHYWICQFNKRKRSLIFSKRKYLLWFSDWSLLITGEGRESEDFGCVAIKWPDSFIRLCSIFTIPPHWQVISSQSPKIHQASSSPPPLQTISNDCFLMCYQKLKFSRYFIWNSLSMWTIKFNSANELMERLLFF